MSIMKSMSELVYSCLIVFAPILVMQACVCDKDHSV